MKELRCGLPTEVMRLLQGAVEGGGVNPEDIAVVEQQSGVNNNNDGVFVEEAVDGKLVHCGVSNLHRDVEEQQAIEVDGEVVKGGRGFNKAIQVDEEEIVKEIEEGDGGSLNLPSDVESEVSETEAEGVADIGTEDISEYEKIRAVYVKQKEKLKRKLKRDWDGCKEGEGLFVTGGQKRAKKLKVVQKEALDLRSEGEDQQCGKSTKKNLGSSGAGLDIWI